MVLLTALSAALVLVVFIVLVIALGAIASTLETIGGAPTSFLAKLRLGLRAIERETSHLEPQVSAVNEGLENIAAGLKAIDGHLVDTIRAVEGQGSSS